MASVIPLQMLANIHTIVTNTPVVLWLSGESAIFVVQEKGLHMNADYEFMTERIKRNVLEVDPDAEVWLYGSRARRSGRDDSDWDVLVLSPKASITLSEESLFIDNMCRLMVETGQTIQLSAYGTADWHLRHSVTPFYHSVVAEGVRL